MGSKTLLPDELHEGDLEVKRLGTEIADHDSEVTSDKGIALHDLGRFDATNQVNSSQNIEFTSLRLGSPGLEITSGGGKNQSIPESTFFGNEINEMKFIGGIEKTSP